MFATTIKTFVWMHHKWLTACIIFTTVQYAEYLDTQILFSPDEGLEGTL